MTAVAAEYEEPCGACVDHRAVCIEFELRGAWASPMPDAGTPTFDPQRLHGPGMPPETDAGSPETDLRKRPFACQSAVGSSRPCSDTPDRSGVSRTPPRSVERRHLLFYKIHLLFSTLRGSEWGALDTPRGGARHSRSIRNVETASGIPDAVSTGKRPFNGSLGGGYLKWGERGLSTLQIDPECREPPGRETRS